MSTLTSTTTTTTTTSTAPPADAAGSTRPAGCAGRAGGVAALVAAATFLLGIALAVTTLADFTAGLDPADAVAFVTGHQTTLFVWYLVIFLLFGAALIPLVRALHGRLRERSPGLADSAAVCGYIWAGLMFATGMISNIGIQAVVDAGDHGADHAATVWAGLDAVTNGLGGGNELVGGLWILLVSVAAVRAAALPRALCITGILTATAGLVTVIPGLTDVGMGFGLGSVVWFVWVGSVLLRRPR